MEENKPKKIKAVTVIYITIIILLTISLVALYYFESVKNNEKISELENNHKEQIKKLEDEKNKLEEQINSSNESTNTNDTNLNKEENPAKDYMVIYKGDIIDKQYGSFLTVMFEENEIDNTITYYNYENGEYVGETKGYFSTEGLAAKISISEKYNAIPRKYERINTIPNELKDKISYEAINLELDKIDLDGNGKYEYIFSYSMPHNINDNENPDERYKYDLLISHIEILDSEFNKISNLVYLESDCDVNLSLKESIEYIDIDNDGKMEILVEIPGWEWRTIEVFKYDNGKILGNIGEYHYASWKHGA